MPLLSVVYAPNMPSKMLAPPKPSPTHRTAVGLLSLVYTPDVTGKGDALTKPSTALRTDMGLLSFVHTPYVLYEMSFLRKVFTTVSTGERFLTLMDTLDVVPKIIFAIKHFGTSLTCIARTSMAPPNMPVSPLNSSKTFPTQHTHEPYPLHHLGRLYLYFNLLLH